MDTRDNPMSVGGQHALQDMVELRMYLVAQSLRMPWPLLPRGAKETDETRRPYSNPLESGVVKELMDRGFIERTSSRTFVVSKSGFHYYAQVMKPHFT